VRNALEKEPAKPDAKIKSVLRFGGRIFFSMIPKDTRLTRTKDFEIIFKNGRFVSDSLVTVNYWKIQKELFPRREFLDSDLKIGFVVSLKISKSAVIRNRAKRQMREVVRLLLKENKIKTGFLIAVVAKKEILNKDYKLIEASIVSALRRAGLFNN
jgi:ribonuclease P protein component